MNRPRRAQTPPTRGVSIGAVLALLAGGILVVQAIPAGPAQARARVVRPIKPHRPPVIAAKPLKPAPIKPITPASLPPLPPAAPFPADAPTKVELIAGDLHASVGSGDASTILPVGGSAVVTVAITDPGGNRQVKLLAEAESGEVGGISSPGLHTLPIPGGLSADIPLPATGQTPINVELDLKSGSKGPDGKLRSRLRLTLLPQKGGRDESIVSWPLTDCSGDYKSELQKLIDQRRATMKDALEAASATVPSLPSGWLFPPPKPAPVAAACRTPRGKKLAMCAALATPPAEAGSAEEARLYKLAGAVLQLKGALPQFQYRTQPLRQASFTLLNGLRLYMEQDPHPALCSGVDYMVQYYQSRTSLLKSTIEETRRALASARSLAISRVAGLAQVSPDALLRADAAELINRVGGAVLPPGEAALLAGDWDVWSKLRTLRSGLGGTASAGLAADRRSAAIAALGVIEAGQYLDIAVGKYSRLDDTVYGTLSAISDAHKRTCVCGP